MIELFEIIRILMIRLLYSDNYYVIAGFIILVILINWFRKRNKNTDLKKQEKKGKIK